MPEFTAAGQGQYDFWLLDGDPDFAIIPGGHFRGIDNDIPIRLQNGNGGFGVQHIRKRHNHWVLKHEPSGCVATLLHRKLSQVGKMHLAYDDRYVLIMRIAPESLIALEYKNIRGQEFMTVITMYFKQGPSNDEELGRYLGYEWTRSPYQKLR